MDPPPFSKQHGGRDYTSYYLMYNVILKCCDNQYQRVTFSIVISATQNTVITVAFIAQ